MTSGVYVRKHKESGEIDSRNHLDADSVIDIALDGEPGLTDHGERIESVHHMDHVTELAFMEEMVTIMVHESTDKNAENPISVGVNGRMQYIFRGHETSVRRKYVERLTRAKDSSFSQDLEALNPVQYNQLKKSTALKYPFSVLKDNNPKGAKWLREILQESA